MDKAMMAKLFGMALDLFKKKAPEMLSKEVAKPVAPIQVKVDPAEIDWENPKARLSENFSVKEALFLPSWGVQHVPSVEEKKALEGIAKKVSKAVDKLEEKLGKKLQVNVHAWMRPGVANIPGSRWHGKDYNRYIYETQVWKALTPEQRVAKKVPNSPHKTGHAIDFHIVGYEGKEKCAEIRKLLEPHLEELGLRMEDMVGGWIHLDDLPVVNRRFFKP